MALSSSPRKTVPLASSNESRQRVKSLTPTTTKRAFYCGVVIEGSENGKRVPDEIQDLVLSFGQPISFSTTSREIASKIAIEEADDQTKHAAVFYCLGATIDGFPPFLVSSSRNFVDCIDVEDVLSGPPGSSAASTTSAPASSLHCTLFLFDDKLVIAKRPGNGEKGGKALAGLDELEKLTKAGGIPMGKKKYSMACKGVLDVIDIVATDVGGADFHLFLESPPQDQSGRWSGRPFRSLSVVKIPVPAGLDPVRLESDKQRFLENLWHVQAMCRSRAGQSVVLQSKDQEVECRAGKTTIARAYYNVYQRTAFLQEPKKTRIVVHVDPLGSADPIPFGIEAPPFVRVRVQTLAGGLCRYSVLSSDPDDEGEEDIVQTESIPNRVVQTVHQFGLFKFKTEGNFIPSTPASRSRGAIFGLDAITRNLFNGRPGSAMDSFAGSISHRRGKTSTVNRSPMYTQTTTTGESSLAKISPRSNSTAAATGLSMNEDDASFFTPKPLNGSKEVFKRGRSPGATASEPERETSRSTSRAGSLSAPPSENGPEYSDYEDKGGTIRGGIKAVGSSSPSSFAQLMELSAQKTYSQMAQQNSRSQSGSSLVEPLSIKRKSSVRSTTVHNSPLAAKTNMRSSPSSRPGVISHRREGQGWRNPTNTPGQATVTISTVPASHQGSINESVAGGVAERKPFLRPQTDPYAQDLQQNPLTSNIPHPDGGGDDVDDGTSGRFTFHDEARAQPYFLPVTSVSELQDSPDDAERTVWDLLNAILNEKVAYKTLLRSKGQRAQAVLDVLQKSLDSENIPEELRVSVLFATIRLCKASGVYPQCLTLRGIRYDNEPIASGSFGDIWKGYLGTQTVCLKVARVYAGSEVENVIKSYTGEAILWGQLNHLNLLPFYGIYPLDGRLGRVGLVSPWMQNGNVTDYLKANPEAPCVPLVHDILAGLGYLHEQQIVHGDLKGANILISPDGSACIADFGLSSVVGPDVLRWTSLGTISKTGGTTRWEAPELMDELEDGTSPRPTFQTDVYSVASVTYEVLTGQIPYYEFPRDATVISRVLRGIRPTRPTSGLALELSDEIWNVMGDCWSADPSKRPTVIQVSEQLREIPQSELTTRRIAQHHLRKQKGRDMEAGVLPPRLFRDVIRGHHPIFSKADVDLLREFQS